MNDVGLTPKKGAGRRWLGWAAAVAPLIAWACWRAIHSDGVYQDDDMMHYLMARWAWRDPIYFLHDWGRPGFTAPYALVAWVGNYAQGLMACRFLTIAIAAISAWLTCACAHELGIRRAWLAGVVLMLMPLYFRLSFATLTETICGFYLIAGTWLLARNKLEWAACFLALAPITRHETVVFLVPVAVYFIARRAWLALLLLGWAEALWNGLALKWYWMLPILRYVESKPNEAYGHGGVLHYVLMWGSAVTPVFVGLSLAGAGLLGARTVRREKISASDAASVFIVIGALGMIALQTLLYYRNVFASGGYPRFLMPAAPWLAVLATVAVDRLLDASQLQNAHRRAVRWVGALTAMGIGMLWCAAHSNVPDASGLIHSLYAGVPGYFVKVCTLPLMLAGLFVAIKPGRVSVTLLLTLCMCWVGPVWSQDTSALRITPREVLINKAIEAAYVSAEGRGIANPDVRGQSPWVAYYTQRQGRAMEPPLDNQWLSSRDKDALYLVVDSATTPPGPERDKLSAVPHQLIFSTALPANNAAAEYRIEVWARSGVTDK